MPFCEDVQAAKIEEQKQKSMIQTVDAGGKTTGKFVPTLYEIFLGVSLSESKEIWGGVGIACIDWN